MCYSRQQRAATDTGPPQTAFCGGRLEAGGVGGLFHDLVVLHLEISRHLSVM